MKDLIHLTDVTNLPLSSNQRRLWIITQQDKENPSYNIPIGYHIKGKIDIDVFKESIQLLFHRQHTMFSIFKQNEGNPYISIVPRQVQIELVDFSGSPDKSGPEEILTYAGEKSRIPFNIEEGPLYRLYLLKETEQSYFFCATIHHLIFDGFSRRLFVQEISRIYSNLLIGVTENIEPLKFYSYDFAAIEKDALSPEIESNLIEFWKEYLKECPTELKFPYDFPRSNSPTGIGCRESFQILPEYSKKLRALGQESNTSLFNALLSLLGILFHKYTGENDICIGVPVSNRRTKPSFEIFGLFVNTLAIRLLINGENKLLRHIKNSNEVFNNAVKNSQLPFEKIVEVLKPDRVPGLNPFYQISFSWINNFTFPLELGDITGERITIPNGTAPFDIAFYMWESGDKIEGEIEYNTDLLTRDTVIRLRDSFMQLIASIVGKPDQNISEISIVSESDKKLLSDFNNTDAPYEQDICIHKKFERQVGKNPDWPALLFKNQLLSYKELNDHANKMANYLISNGVKIEDKVAICIDRSAEMMISIIGILKAGAAYLPLHPENPSERLKSIINDANPRLILTSKLSSTNIPEGTPIIFIDDIISNPLTENSADPDVKVTSKNLAYVLYTSGSTGTPKGVMIEHHSVLNRLGWMQKAYPIDQLDTLLQKTPITFDVSVWELFWWFFNGAKLVLLPKGGEKDPEELINTIDNYKVTTIHFVPSMFATFFETVATRKMFSKLESLNRIFLSGEALPLKLVKEFNAMREFYSLPDLINLYGPTEATVDVSYYNCPGKNIENVFIGKPIDNTKLFVVNDKNIIQPIDVPGELLITGVNLARGYMNRPDLTNEKFFDFKISDGQSIRAYRSGDLVKLTRHGEIDYLGRLDNQVKIRGFRVELGDIEAKILEHPLVTHCAVIVEAKGDHKYVVAYVCLRKAEEITTDVLRTYLFGKLPDYMVPSYVVFLDELPLTSSGKLNRKNLPKIDKIIERSSISIPSNKTEKTLLDLWKNLLKVENLSINDNFFDIGGNSILAINLANLISREFNIMLKALLIFEYPSIKDQSEYLLMNNPDNSSLRNTEIDEMMSKKRNVNFKRNRN